ncbi:FMN-dependent NADH-azoreductase [Mycoplasma simbae]|uniref:FMN-dependent NADH-azoreductase n=1 Tax=Mycoplasma simbae TaxID=36744 RepID=UPI00049622EA|nr:FMN-dependent NADH-azoreductase [Mycoplasma simbae]
MKPVKILSVAGTVNKNSLSEKINVEIMKKIIKLDPMAMATVLNTANSEFNKNVLGANNFAEFFDKTNSDEWIEKLHDTDILILSTPMTNFNYTAGIKNFIDAIAVANKTFSYKYSEKGGSIGLLDKLKVIIVGTQGAPEGWYPFGNFIKNLKGTFKFLGAKKIETILVAGTKVAPRSEQTHEEILEEIDPQLDKIVAKILKK